jgi:hypothetical protein
MSIATNYTSLLSKVAHLSSPRDVEYVYRYCMRTKQASASDALVWAAAGGLPAFLVGRSIGKDLEREKHKNYALAGAAAGLVGPSLLKLITNPSEALPSVSGFDASDIRNLQLESLD